MQAILSNHRGPYRLAVERPFKTKPGFYRTEWLPGEVDSADVEEEVTSLLTDPRDSIVSIGLYSVREGQFVTLVRRQDLDRGILAA